MMTRSLLLLSTALLTACGGGGGGGLGGGTLTPALEAIMQSSSDTMTASLDRGDGVSGVISVANIGLSGASSSLASWSVDDTGGSARVQIGGSTYTLPLNSQGTGFRTFGTPGGRFVNVNESGVATMSGFSNNTTSGGQAGFGYLGVETPVANLPDSTSPVIYAGLWGGQAYQGLTGGGTIGGFQTMSVDFANDSVSGTFEGSLNTGTVTDFSGTLSGSLSGNGMTGSMTPTSGASGSIDFAGNAYGWTADQYAGGIAGSVSTGGGSYAVSGTFSVIID